MHKLFDPITGKAGEIIEAVMASDDIPRQADLQFKIRLCVEEVVENIVNYAYGELGSGFIDVRTQLKDGEWSVTFRDAGVQFNPLEMADPDITAPADQRQIGGLGIFICKQMMDGLDYYHKDGCNILVMRKKIQ